MTGPPVLLRRISDAPLLQAHLPQVTQGVVLQDYSKLPKNGASDYYVLEQGQYAIRWCVLRVQRSQIQIGLRKG